MPTKHKSKSESSGNKSKEVEVVTPQVQEKKQTPEKIVQTALSMMMQSGPVPPQILEKITPKHIDKVLDISEKTNKYIHEDKKYGRRYVLIFLVVGIITLLALVFGLVNTNKEVLIQVLTILISFGGGFGAGYGYRTFRPH